MSVSLVLVALAIACEIPLLILRKLVPQLEPHLPLGGDELTQLGILALGAIFVGQLYELVPQLIRTLFN
ncbi:hypothetical protein CI1B_31940 [Bradyrhizobium ivorense]|uniref:Uncharacterized protein n=2 Tax=Bradyrhizobium ivorense TaxID=2511166 RepID=A0A508T8E1_9BRAD|nr:hypothetical protein CI1B_31940 [Bradyrhizobium ivorense]VIO79218.1 hypothetical protein CI41S_67860 [Bradyrhizobium ivorense]